MKLYEAILIQLFFESVSNGKEIMQHNNAKSYESKIIQQKIKDLRQEAVFYFLIYFIDIISLLLVQNAF